MPQLAQRFRLDLANAFAGDAEALAHLFERALMAVDEAESELEHATFTRRERVEDVLDLGAQHGQRRCVGRRRRLLVLDKVTEVRILFLADRRFQRDRVLRDLGDLANLLRRDPHLLGDLLVVGLATQLLEQADAKHGRAC